MKTIKLFSFLLFTVIVLGTLVSCEKDEKTYTYEEYAYPPEYKEFFEPTTVLPIEDYANTRWEWTWYWKPGNETHLGEWRPFEEIEGYDEKERILFTIDDNHIPWLTKLTENPDRVETSYNGYIYDNNIYRFGYGIFIREFYPIKRDIIIIRNYFGEYLKYERIN